MGNGGTRRGGRGMFLARGVVYRLPAPVNTLAQVYSPKTVLLHNLVPWTDVRIEMWLSYYAMIVHCLLILGFTSPTIKETTLNSPAAPSHLTPQNDQ